MPYCEHCGTEGGGDYCSNCGQVRSFAAKTTAASAPVPAQGVPASRSAPPPPWPDQNPPTTRKVGIGLGIGIVFLPFIFAWFTLRRGHTGMSKGVAFGWFGILLIANINSGTSNKETAVLAPASAVLTAATTEAPRVQAEREELPLDVAATALWRSYQDNEVAADAQFKGKRLRVTGVVASISKDFIGNIVVRLRSENQFMNTMATMQSSEASRTAELSKGDRLTVVCLGGGMVIGSPVLSACVIR